MSEFEQHGVVPDTIPSPPPAIAKVVYGSSHTVNLGNVLSIATTQSTPTILAPTDHNMYYTIMMIDPDALSRSVHEFRHFLHWLVINVEGKGGAALDTNGHGAHTVCSYLGPAPPPDTGYHRYIQLIYQQPNKISDVKTVKSIAENSMEERKSFHPHLWLQQTFHSQTQPVLRAANFYLAGTPDESRANQTSQQMKDEAKEKGDTAKDKAGVDAGKDDKDKAAHEDKSKK